MKLKVGLGMLACGALVATAALPAPPAYVVYDTGTLGGTVGLGNGINNIGWISGVSTTAEGALHAALWSPGRVIDLGTLGGANSAVEWPVKNNHDLVVGISESASGTWSGVLHTFVAIVAPGATASAAPSGVEAAARPAVSAELRARVLQQQRPGRIAPSPVAAQ